MEGHDAPRPERRARDPAGGPPRGAASGWCAEAFGAGERPPEALLEELFALVPDERWRALRGRESFPWPGRPGLVVKRFHGGEARDWWYERLRETDPPRSPGRREAENLLRLAEDGVPVPRVLAWVEEDLARRYPGRGGRQGRSALVMERVLHEGTLRRALARSDAAGRRRLGRTLVELVARMHAAGWYHRDLYLEHVLIDARGGLVLLDAGRARREPTPRERWFVKDLAALLYSTPGAVLPSERMRFLAEWLRRHAAVAPEAEGGGRRRDLRRWARVVQAKARRLARHAPRTDAGSEASA